MLLSATARAQRLAGVTSTQLNSAEAIGLLRSASALSKVEDAPLSKARWSAGVQQGAERLHQANRSRTKW
jgi:hypothetical protein